MKLELKEARETLKIVLGNKDYRSFKLPESKQMNSERRSNIKVRRFDIDMIERKSVNPFDRLE